MIVVETADGRRLEIPVGDPEPCFVCGTLLADGMWSAATAHGFPDTPEGWAIEWFCSMRCRRIWRGRPPDDCDS